MPQRKNQNTKPLSKEESQRLLNNSKKQEDVQDMHKMYNLIKEDEKNKEIIENFQKEGAVKRRNYKNSRCIKGYGR